jgi:hypothetical protein
MWAVLIGFALGVVTCFFARWIATELGPIYQVVTDPEGATWLRTLLVGIIILTSAIWLGVIFVVAHTWPPAAATFERPEGWDLLWTLFHSTRVTSACIGFALGLATTAWGIHAAGDGANVGLLGGVVGAAVAIVVLVALDHDFQFLSRVSKVSTSVISFELDTARGGASNRGANGPSGSVTATWTASAPASTALSLLEDLSSNAIDRDNEVARVLADSAGAVRSADEEIDKQRELFGKALGPFVVLRSALHSIKRDAHPTFFYTEKQELVGLAVNLRDLVLLDVRRESPSEPKQKAELTSLRETRLDAAAKALVEMIRRSRDEVCGLQLWTQTSLKAEDAMELRKAASCADESRAADLQKIKDFFPGRSAVRKTPYLTIMAAALFFGSGEREAAAALVDQWRQQVPEKSSAAAGEESKYRDKLAAIHDVRMVNLMGLVLAEPKNAVLIELATRYQWRAMELSDGVIGSNPRLTAFAAKMQTAKNEPGLIAIAADLAASRKTTCPSDPKDKDLDVPKQVSYFVYRRNTQLNNAIFYLTLQSNIRELEGVSDRLEEWMNKLSAARQDCLALRIGKSWDAMKSDVAGLVDTLAHAYLAQAALRKADADRSRKALCRAYRAALIADKLAGPPSYFVSADLNASLFANGSAISKFQFKNLSRQNLRTTREQVEGAGEGACSDILPGKLDQWIDD